MEKHGYSYIAHAPDWVTGDLTDMARLYSSEVEYSEENLDELLWTLDE